MRWDDATGIFHGNVKFAEGPSDFTVWSQLCPFLARLFPLEAVLETEAGTG